MAVFSSKQERLGEPDDRLLTYTAVLTLMALVATYILGNVLLVFNDQDAGFAVVTNKAEVCTTLGQLEEDLTALSGADDSKVKTLKETVNGVAASFSCEKSG